jgi:EmrB/QacA subfamily drug resistance transporter
MTQTHRWRAFAVLAISFFMTIVDLTIVNVALPTIGRKLHFSESNLQWVVTAYGLTFGGFLLLGGRAADMLGRRRVLMVGLAVFTAASLGSAVATTDAVLIAMRGIQGLGAAIVLPAALSIVMNMFEEGAERNKALGIWGGIGAGGATVGLIAGGLLTRYVGWQSIFFLNVPIGAVALLLAPRLVPESRLQTTRRRYDPFGALTVTGGLLLLVYTISKAPQVGWGSGRTVGSLVGSGALLIAFLVIETRVESPLMPLGIFRLKTLAGANAVGLLLGGSFFAFIFTGTLYMQQVLGYSALKTGLAWLAASITSVAFAGLSQVLVTRGSAKLVMAAGMTMIGGGIAWGATVPVHGHFWANLAGPFFVTGMGTAFAFIPVSIAALAGIAEHEAGLAAGLLNTSQQLGGAIGVAIASTVAASRFKTSVHTGATNAAALTTGFESALWVCAVIGLAAIPVTFLLVRRDELAKAIAASAVTLPSPRSHPRNRRPAPIEQIMVRYKVWPDQVAANIKLREVGSYRSTDRSSDRNAQSSAMVSPHCSARSASPASSRGRLSTRKLCGGTTTRKPRLSNWERIRRKACPVSAFGAS